MYEIKQHILNVFGRYNIMEHSKNGCTLSSDYVHSCFHWKEESIYAILIERLKWKKRNITENISMKYISGGHMQGYNCIMVFSQDEKELLFCKRTKDPYKGLYNLVGGKIEQGESGFEAAYRELEEETGIGADKIQLSHMMDFTYYNQDCRVEVYVGQLKEEAILFEEAHPLLWLSVDEDYFDSSRFAGEGNIGHMLEQVKIYGAGEQSTRLL